MYLTLETSNAARIFFFKVEEWYARIVTDFKVLDFASQGSNPMMNDFSLAGIKLASGE